MRWAKGSAGALVVVTLLCAEPASAHPPDAPEGDAVSDVVFDAIVDRYARLLTFVRRLEEQREALLFAHTTALHERAAVFMRHLEREREVEQERRFEEQLSRFLRVREFMQRLRAPAPVEPGAPTSSAGPIESEAG